MSTHHVRSPHSSRERGQATVLIAAVVAIAALVAVGVGDVGMVMLDRQRASTAADAAALAGVDGGEAAAGEAARRNGGVLIRFARQGADVVVVVRLGRAHATARAGNGP